MKMMNLAWVMLVLSATVYADDEDLKDFTACQNGVRDGYQKDRDFCYKNETDNYSRKECMAIAERHRSEELKNCNDQEQLDTVMNPSVNVRMPWSQGGSSNLPFQGAQGQVQKAQPGSLKGRFH